MSVEEKIVLCKNIDYPNMSISIHLPRSFGTGTNRICLQGSWLLYILLRINNLHVRYIHIYYYIISSTGCNFYAVGVLAICPLARLESWHDINPCVIYFELDNKFIILADRKHIHEVSFLYVYNCKYCTESGE